MEYVKVVLAPEEYVVWRDGESATLVLNICIIGGYLCRKVI